MFSIQKRLFLAFCAGYVFSLIFNYLLKIVWSSTVSSLLPISPQHYIRIAGEKTEEDDHKAFNRMIQGAQTSVQNWNDTSQHIGEEFIANYKHKRVRILCFIFTCPANHKTKAIHVKATWAKRCNKYIFMSSKEDSSLPTVDLKLTEGRNKLWNKTMKSVQYIYKHFLNDFDFFFKADDDTYAIMENMRLLLEDFSPNDPVYFGKRFKVYVKNGYASGGAGYVLSREALKRVVEVALNPVNPKCNLLYTGAEDRMIGECLQNIGVRFGDSRDLLGRERFHPLGPWSMMRTDYIEPWMINFSYYPLKRGVEACSDSSVTFHYIQPAQMYQMEFFVYHLYPHGILRDYKRSIDFIKNKLKNAEHDNLVQT